jgi:transposase
MGDAQQQRNRRRFTEEFKREAVNLVRSTGRPIAAVGRELGIYDSTLETGCARTASDRGEAEGYHRRAGPASTAGGRERAAADGA